MDLFIKSGADFDDDRKNRYVLWRIWDDSKPMVMFIGLNPSKANESKPDPTITRVIGFAKSWGYGGIYMLNLFPYVTPYPEELVETTDEDKWLNSLYLCEYGDKSQEVVFAWGNFKVARQFAKTMAQQFTNAKALIMNKNGSPRHPLYVKGDTKLINFKL